MSSAIDRRSARSPRVARAVLLAVVILAPAAVGGQAPVVAPGDGSVDGSRVRMGTFTYKLDGRMGEQQIDLGTLTRDVTAQSVDGRAVIRTVQTNVSRMGTSVDTSFADAQSMVPVSFRGHSPGGTLFVDFAGTRVTGERRDHEGSGQPIDQTLKQAVFDSNIIDVLVTALPLKQGYAARLPVFIYEQGGLMWFDVKVGGERTVSGRPAWDVTLTLPDGVMRYAVDKALNTQVAGEYTAASGMTMSMIPVGK